jgi:hypothetical protein
MLRIKIYFFILYYQSFEGFHNPGDKKKESGLSLSLSLLLEWKKFLFSLEGERRGGNGPS